MTKEGLRETRKELGLTQEQLAQRLGVTTTTIARWESGRITFPVYLERAMKDLVREIKKGSD